MILFLHGAGTYFLKEKLDQIRDKAKSQGVNEANVVEMDGSAATVAEVSQVIRSGSLLSAKQLVIVRDWLLTRPADETKQLLEVITDTPDSTILVMAEFGEPDKRLVGFKGLQKLAAKTWVFPSPDEAFMRRWLGRRAGSLGVKLSPPVAQTLVAHVGLDAWGLASELDKLSVAAESGEITEELVDSLVSEQAVGNVFTLVDALGRRDPKTSLAMLRTLGEAGEPALRVFAMIVRQFRLLLGIQALLAEKQPDAAIARQLGAHPFVVRKMRGQAALYSESELKDIYRRLTELDHQVKTGRREPEAMLELFIIEVCEQGKLVKERIPA